MKILITGGAGFIGTHIINQLQSTDIIVLDNFLEQVHGSNPILIDGVEYIKGDVSNIKDIQKALDHKPDIVIHLAAETGTGQSMYEITRYIKTNVEGTANLLQVLNNTDHNVKKIILSSSRAVYGEHSDTEEIVPASIYGLTKFNQEQIMKMSCPVPYTIFRYQNVYGPGQSIKNPYTGIISIFSEKFKKGESIDIWDNGMPTRDFVYVKDVVDATLLAIDNEITDYKIYNVGTGKSVKVLDIAKKLRDMINTKCQINVTDYHRPGDIMHAKGNIDKITNETNWSPTWSIDDGLESFVSWFKEISS
jgi:dTDP-L-rhamnose 4-epimerase